MTDDGQLSNDDVILLFCRNDQENELSDILDKGEYTINYADSIGNTAAHYAAKFGSIGCLELLVNLDDIDLDIKNRMEGNTPLHMAVRYAEQDEETAISIIDLLLQADADPSIRNNANLTPAMLLDPRRKEIKKMLDEAAVAAQLDDSDIVQDDDEGFSDDDDQASD
ncbi:ankyrin repeat-containing domain protein [Radiomyces spectabilis]|uniref:ankyrin repeat-containing domain protein n=1 Tax=Radiomyces spectabilis TaxID=64574 RepID=UPI00221F4AE1|nr:ankyrin repeat-containing domain protein [Radiomyces spectabilis]KAI8381386.1 ankyrin repeat-containing domain protein [Radiomyces spectabilis]